MQGSLMHSHKVISSDSSSLKCSVSEVVNILHTTTSTSIIINTTPFIIIIIIIIIIISSSSSDRLCGLVVKVSGYRCRGPGFDPRFSE